MQLEWMRRDLERRYTPGQLRAELQCEHTCHMRLRCGIEIAKLLGETAFRRLTLLGCLAVAIRYLLWSTPRQEQVAWTETVSLDPSLLWIALGLASVWFLLVHVPYLIGQLRERRNGLRFWHERTSELPDCVQALAKDEAG